MSLGTAVRQLQQRYSTAQIREMIRLYTAAYGNSGMNARQVLEEMVCDAMGKMNAFATEETSTVAGEVGQFLRDLRKTALETQTDGQKNNAQEGVKYSLVGINQDGIEVYETSDDVKALSYKERRERFMSIMESEYRGRTAKFTRGGQTYYATFDDADIRKNIYGDKRSDRKGWRAKINTGADGNVFELVENAQFDKSKAEQGKTIESHKDVLNWDYFVKTVQIDGNVFNLLANVRKKADGAFVYSIQLKENRKMTASPPLGPRRASNGVTNTVKNTITQKEQNVKQKYSRELDSEYMELAKDPEGNRWELQEMVDQAAEMAGYEYKRNTGRKHSPANDVPWQMFVRGVDKYQGNYGDYTYYATDKGATPIDEIMPKLRELAEEFYGETVSDEEINPPDIVMSAGVWDDMDFVQYAWDNYFEGEMDRTGKVPAVVTEDGMIVIDEDFSRVKSGDTVEYDDNGKVIPLSERFNSDKRDIRYSRELETVEALKRQNEILQKQRDYWKEQTRTTDEKTRGADKGEVRSLAGQLIRQYSSKTEVEEILPEMQWLADSIWRNDPKISYTDLQDSAQNIARMVLDGSEVNLNAENWETGQELKRFLRGRYINVDESLKEDIGDFKNFKRSNRSLHFRENGTGTGVDSLWLELQNDFGKGLFPDSISNPGDQIRHIADTLTSLTESDMRNPYAADMELTVEQMAYDVMARAAGLNRQKATKADNTADSPLLYSVRMLTWAEVSWSMLPSS